MQTTIRNVPVEKTKSRQLFLSYSQRRASEQVQQVYCPLPKSFTHKLHMHSRPKMIIIQCLSLLECTQLASWVHYPKEMLKSLRFPRKLKFFQIFSPLLYTYNFNKRSQILSLRHVYSVAKGQIFVHYFGARITYLVKIQYSG